MPSEADASAPALRLCHKSAFRARLRPERPPADTAAAQQLADQLARLPGVQRVQVRPGTGSVIVITETDAGEVLEAAVQAGQLRLLAAAPPVQVGPSIELGLAMADMQMKSRTEGALDLKTALALLLLLGAGVQLARGRVAGPATTLLMSAVSLLVLPGSAKR